MDRTLIFVPFLIFRRNDEVWYFEHVIGFVLLAQEFLSGKSGRINSRVDESFGFGRDDSNEQASKKSF